MATNFSPCKGSYVLNQFPSNVMFGMNGFHVSASGAIQGHHGPLVLVTRMLSFSHIVFKDLYIGVIRTRSLERPKSPDDQKMQENAGNCRKTPKISYKT